MWVSHEQCRSRNLIWRQSDTVIRIRLIILNKERENELLMQKVIFEDGTIIHPSYKHLVWGSHHVWCLLWFTRFRMQRRNLLPRASNFSNFSLLGFFGAIGTFFFFFTSFFGSGDFCCSHWRDAAYTFYNQKGQLKIKKSKIKMMLSNPFWSIMHQISEGLRQKTPPKEEKERYLTAIWI